MNKLMTNVQIKNKENKFGRVSEYEFWTYEDAFYLFSEKINDNEYSLIINKYNSMIDGLENCFPNHKRRYSLIKEDFYKGLKQEDLSTKSNTIYGFYLYKISMFTDSYVREYPVDLKSFSDEEIGLVSLVNFRKTPAYQDLLFLKKWLNENRDIKKFHPANFNKIILKWKECEFVIPSKVDIFMENNSYAIFDAKRNGYVSRSNQCGVISNAMIFENEKKAKSFSKSKKIENDSYIIKLKIEVDSIASQGKYAGKYDNDLKEALSNKEKNKMMTTLENNNENLKNLRKRL